MKMRNARGTREGPDVEIDRASALDGVDPVHRFVDRNGIYVVLGALLVAAVVVTIRYPDHPMVERLGPNVASEMLGIIVTLAFVQRLLERQDRARKLRAAVGALRKGRVALNELVTAWAGLVKGGLDPRRTEYPRTVRQLFAPHYTEALALLDPARGDWLAQAEEEVTRARHTLYEVMLIYGSTLDPDYLEALAEVVDDPFASLLVELAKGPPISAEEWRRTINRSRGHLAAHFVRLNHAAALHNRLAQEAARFRSRHLAPSAQLLNLQLNTDRDLTLEMDVPAGWWSTEPAVGSLRPSEPPRSSAP
jgi:hypothetical protein